MIKRRFFLQNCSTKRVLRLFFYTNWWMFHVKLSCSVTKNKVCFWQHIVSRETFSKKAVLNHKKTKITIKKQCLSALNSHFVTFSCLKQGFCTFVSRETRQNQLSAFWARCFFKKTHSSFTSAFLVVYITCFFGGVHTTCFGGVYTTCFTWNFLYFFLFFVLNFFIFCFLDHKITKKSPKTPPNRFKIAQKSFKSCRSHSKSFENYPKSTPDSLQTTQNNSKSFKIVLTPTNHREPLGITKNYSKTIKMY